MSNSSVVFMYIYLSYYIKRTSRSIQPFHIWNVSFHIIISRTKVYHKDLQKIKFESF